MPKEELKTALARWIAEGKDVIGQVKIETRGEGYLLRHLEDIDAPEAALALHRTPSAARLIARNDAQGDFRPIKTAPTLIKGWRLALSDIAAVHLAREFFYPAAVGMALAQERSTLMPVPLRDLLGRQTGMYRFANGITDAQASDLIGNCCATRTKCLRRIVYPLGCYAGVEWRGSRETGRYRRTCRFRFSRDPAALHGGMQSHRLRCTEARAENFETKETA